MMMLNVTLSTSFDCSNLVPLIQPVLVGALRKRYYNLFRTFCTHKQSVYYDEYANAQRVVPQKLPAGCII